jgi:hypothetical protein
VADDFWSKVDDAWNVNFAGNDPTLEDLSGHLRKVKLIVD